ncbi:MAG: hypothetical protein V3U51_00325 [Thermoplasmata archaeon]
MKSKIAIFSCLAVAAMMVLPTVSAGTMTADVWTDKSSYQVGEDVQISANWIVTDPNDFLHDECHVVIDIEQRNSYKTWQYEGHYDVPERQATGAAPVWCGGADGFANYQWDSTGQDVAYYDVYLTVTSWDYSQTPPDDEIVGLDDTFFQLTI